MPDILDMNEEAVFLSQKIEYLSDSLRSEKKKLVPLEDSIIENREKLSSLKEEIRLKELATDFKSLIDENRALQILGLRESLANK